MRHGESYELFFFVLSALVAMLGAWTALDLFRRVRVNTGLSRISWLAGTALIMGLSIWAMHFIAMLGWRPGVAVRYAPGLTALSLVLPIVGTGGGFLVAASPKVARSHALLAGLIMGAAICAMHYVGMAAVRGPLTLSHDLGGVVLSYVVAAAASGGALWAVRRDVGRGWRALAAAVLGLAVVSMHYLGIAALHVRVAPEAVPLEPGAGPLVLALAVSSGSIILLLVGLAASLYDRRLQALAAFEAETLRRSERQLRSILDQSPVGILVADGTSGEIRFGNAEAVRILGRGVLSGRISSYHDEGLVDEAGEPVPPREYPLPRALRTGVRIDRERLRWRRGDGVRTLEVTAAPVHGEDGTPELAIVAFADVTDQVASERALAEATRMEAVGQLTGGVAHDFNNLLTAVLGNLSLARKRVQDERVGRWLDNAAHGARRGAALTAQLLAFSRRQELETRPVDVNARIFEMGGLLVSAMGGEVTVALELAPDLPPAMADPTQLELAVLNLSINARDAMTGAGTLTVATGARRMEAPGAPHEPEPGDYVAVSVSDTGAGMSGEVLARVFEPFFTTKPPGKGSGLGLSQVLGLAKQMGGGVSVRSRVGRGTTVELFLPVAAAAAEPAPPPPRPVAPAEAAGARVLVVDDDADVRAWLQDVLTEAGCEVAAAPGGREALAMVAGGLRPSAMVLDVAMPDMNGVETARRLRELTDAPALMITGYAEADSLPEALDHARLLLKPFPAEALLERLCGLLAARAA